MYIPYFLDYKSQFFSCHGGRSTYIAVRPSRDKVISMPLKHRSETIGLLTDNCIPVGCIGGTEPCIMQVAGQITVGVWVGGQFDLSSGAAGCILTRPVYWASAATVRLQQSAGLNGDLRQGSFSTEEEREWYG